MTPRLSRHHSFKTKIRIIWSLTVGIIERSISRWLAKCKVNVFRALVSKIFCYSKPTGFFNHTLVIAMSRITNRLNVPFGSHSLAKTSLPPFMVYDGNGALTSLHLVALSSPSNDRVRDERGQFFDGSSGFAGAFRPPPYHHGGMTAITPPCSSVW